MFQRIIVPLDGSDLSLKALDYGLAMADKFAARLTLVRAVDGPEQTARMLASMEPAPGVGGVVDPTSIEFITRAAEAEAANARAEMADLARSLSEGGRQVEAVVLEGSAADVILQTAHAEPDSIVVMSTHGRSGVSRLVFGSVARAVLQDCHAPMLLIRVLADAITEEGRDLGSDLSIGAEVWGTDGRLGEVSRIVTEETGGLRGIVVKRGGLFSEEREVRPRDVNRIEGGVVYLNLDSVGFETLDRYEEERERLLDRSVPPPPGPTGADLAATAGPAGMVMATPPTATRYPLPAGAADDPSQATIRLGMDILAADGEKVGEVAELSVDPRTGAPTRLTVRRGFLFKREIAVPVDWVSSVSDEGILLRVSKNQLELYEESNPDA